MAAESQLQKAHRFAIKTLMEQQEAAAELLLAEQRDAVSAAEVTEADASQLPTGPGEQLLATRASEADVLLEVQRRAAEMLRMAQEAAAAVLRDAVDRAATETLLKAHREAAAILLEARMRVEAEQASAGVKR